MSEKTEKGNGSRRVIVACLVLFALLVSNTSIDPNDTFWHIRSGQYYVEHGQVPSVDIFSHTAAGKHVYQHEWLSQVILYYVHKLFGFAGIRVLNSLMAGVSMLLLWCFFRRATNRLLPVLFAIAVIFPDFLGRMNTRPEIFTLPLFVAFLGYILQRDRTRLPGVRTLIVVGLIAALWANLHGMALLGLMFLGVHLAGHAITLALGHRFEVSEWESVTRRGFVGDAMLFAVFAAAVLASPMGIDIYVHAYKGREFLPGPLGIMEWLSPFTFLSGILRSFLTQDFPWINVPMGWQFLFLVIPLAYFFSLPFLAARGRLPTPPEILVVLLAIYQGASAVRFRWLFFIPLFYVVRAIAKPRERVEGEKSATVGHMILQPFMLIVMLCGSFMLLTRGISLSRVLDTAAYPVGIANYLEDIGAQGRLYNGYNWGGYLIFRLWPECKVFIDGRTDLYSYSDPNLMLDHVAIEQKDPGYEELLDYYNVDIIIATQSVYFPGPEVAEEIRRQREERMRSMSGGDLLAQSDAAVFPRVDESNERDAITREWVPVLRNREGSVYVRATPDNAETVARVAAFMDEQAVPFDSMAGPDEVAIIVDHPDLAVRYNLITESIVAGVGGQLSSAERIAALVEFARSLTQLELLPDAIAVLEEVLKVDRYDGDALLLAAYTSHLVGDNDGARRYLERGGALAGNETARMLLQHCASHRPPKSTATRRLPPLGELATKWKAYLP